MVALEEGVDPLSGAFEVAGCLADAHVLFGHGFDDGEMVRVFFLGVYPVFIVADN